jgi:hypothetical protein
MNCPSCGERLLVRGDDAICPCQNPQCGWGHAFVAKPEEVERLKAEITQIEARGDAFYDENRRLREALDSAEDVRMARQRRDIPAMGERAHAEYTAGWDAAIDYLRAALKGEQK